MEVASHVQKHTSSRGVTSLRAWKAAERRVWARLAFCVRVLAFADLAFARSVRPRWSRRDVGALAIHV